MKPTQMLPESHRSEHISWLRAAVLGANDGILASNVEFEGAELAQIYVGRGLEPDLAAKVAEQLMAHDALGSHARDELGITAGIGSIFGTVV